METQALSPKLCLFGIAWELLGVLRINLFNKMVDLCFFNKTISHHTIPFQQQSKSSFQRTWWVYVVDLAKRLCDGSAPCTINGCLRTYVNRLEEMLLTPALEKQKVAT